MSSPSVSVCTTVLNEGAILSRCLRSFRKQLEPGDEIVICDAGSVDGSIEIERKYSDIVVVHPYEDGQPISRGKGRQIATEHASGDIIVSTDGDCIVPDGYIDTIKHYFMMHPEVTWVWGDVYDLEGRMIRTAASLLTGKFWDGGGGCNSAFRRDVFNRLRGYQDRNWWEDTELYNDFPGKKTHIDNPVSMELDSRFTEPFWLAAFAVLGISYTVWKVKISRR